MRQINGNRGKRTGPPVDTTDPAYLESLLQFARDLGLDRVGVTDASPLSRARVAIDDRNLRGLSDTMGFTYRNPSRSTEPNTAVEGARSIIVAARSYHSEQPEHPGGMVARVARYAQDDHYTPLRQALQQVALRLRADGHRAVVFADENNVVDREVAYRAGLGWFGKNANILLPGAGSFFSLGSVVTTAVLAPAAQPAPDGCGTCRACYDECPTQAIVADGVIDAWIDFNTHGVWDYLASAFICQEAGALIVEHQDRSLVVHEHGQRRTPIAAATSELLASVRQVRAQQN